MKMRFYHFVLLSGLSLGGLMSLNFEAKAGLPTSVQSNVVGISADGGTAVSRLISTALKYFLSDDTELVAELIWKEGGCGDCYKGDGSCSGSNKLKLSAALSDLSVETDLYQADAIEKTCVADIAQKRLDASTDERASLAALDVRGWELQYQSQRRAIQALTDAFNAKRIYNELKDVATSSMNDYSDYSKGVSSVASKRLLLDQLLALKKRVIAARLRVRAQTLDVNAPDLQRVQTPPDLSGICESALNSSNSDSTVSGNNNPT